MTQVSSNSTNEKEVTETNVSSEEDYKLIEGALLQNPRGRWFLEEYIQRNRPEDTQKLLSAIQRIENTLSEKPEATAATQEIDPIRMSIIEMSKAIAKTREEIASIKPNDEQDNQIITATEELSAIVESTENATNTILEAAEEIQEAAWSLRETGAEATPCDKIDEKTTDIYTACSFQDITGQRTTKVVQALCYIENRVNAMIDIWDLQGATGADNKGPIQDNSDTRPDSHLLNGPALKGDGLEQGCVDDMLTNSPESADANATSDQDMVDEMSFDSIGSSTDAVPNTDVMDADDVDAMSFDAIDLDTSPEEAVHEEPFLQEPSLEEPSMELSESSFEQEVASDNLETMDDFAIDLNQDPSQDPRQETAEETSELQQTIATPEMNEAIPKESSMDEENMLATEPEEMLATELVTPITNPLEDTSLEESISIDETSSEETEDASEEILNLVSETNLEPQSPGETLVEENNPLLQESHDLDDIDIAEFETDLATTSPDELIENLTSPLDPNSDEINPGQIDLGDIEITDLDTPETDQDEMSMAEDGFAETSETPITSQDELNNLEETDIENLTEMQEQALLNN